MEKPFRGRALWLGKGLGYQGARIFSQKPRMPMPKMPKMSHRAFTPLRSRYMQRKVMPRAGRPGMRLSSTFCTVVVCVVTTAPSRVVISEMT